MMRDGKEKKGSVSTSKYLGLQSGNEVRIQSHTTEKGRDAQNDPKWKAINTPNNPVAQTRNPL